MEQVTVSGAGVTVGGWKTVRVMRGIEQLAGSFQVEMTERFPSAGAQVPLPPGLPVEIRLGDELVLTGYVDQYTTSIAGREHTIRAAGRSKTGDLIDCSAIWPRQQMVATDIVDLAEKLAEPYGVEVVGLVGTGLTRLPQFNINKGDTVFEVLEHWNRFSATLCYDDPQGRLVIARAGKERGATGLVEGANVESASVSWAADQRFSRYVMYGLGFSQLPYFGDQQALFSKDDPGVGRERYRYMLAEHQLPYLEVAQLRLDWEVNRRTARGMVVQVRVDSWRNGDGLLWQPNTLVPVSLPTLNVTGQHLLIGDVTYTLDESGTHADLVLMDARGFDPQPMGYGPVLIDGFTGRPIQGR